MPVEGGTIKVRIYTPETSVDDGERFPVLFDMHGPFFLPRSRAPLLTYPY